MAGMAGMGLGALPMSPALVAAALNQAGWGLIGNLGGGPGQAGAPGPPGTQPGDHGGFPTPTSFPATVAPGPTTVANSGTSNGSPAAPGFLGWGASPGAGAEAGPGAGQSQQATPPQHGQAAAAAAAAGTWSTQPRDRQGERAEDLKRIYLQRLVFQEPDGNTWSKRVEREDVIASRSRCSVMKVSIVYFL